MRYNHVLVRILIGDNHLMSGIYVDEEEEYYVIQQKYITVA